MMKPSSKIPLVVYEDTPDYSWIVRFLIAFALALTFLLGLWAIWLGSPLAAVLLFIVTLFDATLFWAILPRKYRIREDGLEIVLGRPFCFIIPLDSIESARISSQRWSFSKANFGTLITRKPVEIVRRKDMSVLITPRNPSFFLERLDKALADWRNEQVKER